jgi:hypothetical protein
VGFLITIFLPSLPLRSGGPGQRPAPPPPE